MEEAKWNIAAPVFNIQGYSIHDGPGIRTTVFVKGCPLRCIWCQNPESNLAKPQLMSYKSKCTGCGRCISACPEGAIRIVQDGETGKYIAKTDPAKCVDCGKCVPLCPASAREIAGERKTVREVYDKVSQDKLFYAASGGGVTISGGEALIYPDFCAALFEACKEDGIHTAIETSSYAKREAVDQIYEFVDLAMLDIKHMDSETHRQLTGVGNELILDNIKHICHDLKKEIMIRIPCIPTCNDDVENIRATARFVHDELGPEVQIQLLPYNNLGESKNESLGKDIYMKQKRQSDACMEELRQAAEAEGIKAMIGGSF